MSLTYVCNAFSLSMLDRETQKLQGAHQALPWPLSLEQAREIATRAAERSALVSAIGHVDTARIVSELLGVETPVNRTSVKLVREVFDPRSPKPCRIDRALVAQYVGPRLPEGATQLPEGATIEWWLV